MEELKSNMKNEIIEPTSEELENDSVSEFYRIFNENFDNAIEQSPLGDFLLNQIKGGSKTVYSKTIRETKVFETSFIPILESAFLSISKILRDPKKNIRYDEEVVPMEKAKKVNATTVRHLASHTQYIKEVTEDGDIIPSKLLTTFADDEVGIYENRFVKTLINRICKFLSLRLQILKKNIDSYETKNTTVTNSFKVEETKVKVELSVKMERQLGAQVKSAKETFNKIKDLSDRFKTLRSSKLMMELKNYKEVVPPIMKTNIILKNAEFKICYNTWVFLDRYTQLAFDVNVREKKNPYSDELSESVNNIMTASVGTMLHYYGNTEFDEENLPYKEFTTRKARMLSKIEDEYKFNPSSQKIEKFNMSEFFLNQTIQHFEKSLDDKVASGMAKDYSLDLVFREMQAIVNAIYPPLYEVEEDIYDEVPLAVKLERTKKRAEVLETVTRLKEIDYKSTLKEEQEAFAEIVTLEEKIRQQEAREKRLAEMARQKAERAAQRAKEKEEAQQRREEEAQQRREEREAEMARKREEREAEKLLKQQQMEERKAKIQENKELMAERAAARKLAKEQEKQKAIDEAKLSEDNRIAQEKKLSDDISLLEQEKANLSPEELIERNKQIEEQREIAEKAKSDSLKKSQDLDKYQSEDDEDDEDGGTVDKSVDVKTLLQQRREAIRQKALANKNLIDDEDDDEEDDEDEENVGNKVDAKTLLQQRREAIRQKALASRGSLSEDDDEDDEDDEEETTSPKVDPKAELARRRELIKQKALAAQSEPSKAKVDEDDEDDEDDEEETTSPKVDPKAELARRRELIKQKALAAQSKPSKAKVDEDDEDDDEDDDEVSTSTKLDPKAELVRRRELIKQKALAAQSKPSKAKVDEDDEDDEDEEEIVSPKVDPKAELARRRELIKQKALAAQSKPSKAKVDEDDEDDEDEEEIVSPKVDPKAELARRRELIKQKALAAQSKPSKAKVDEDDEDDEDDEEVSTSTKLDPKAELARRRELIKQKALAAQSKPSKAKVDEDDEDDDEYDEEVSTSTKLDPKAELARRRELIKQKALAAKNKRLADEDEDDFEDVSDDERERLLKRRESLKDKDVEDDDYFE